MFYQSKNLFIENSSELEIQYEDFSFKKDHVSIIKGKSGIGKSTLLNVLGLLNRNFKNGSEIQLGLTGQTVSLHHLDERESEKLRKKYFSYILQDDHLIDSMSVLNNILFPSYFKNNRQELIDRLNRLLENNFLSSIAGRLNKSSAILSGGEKKKVALLRAMLKDHEILIADEPWTSLGKDDVDRYTDFFIEYSKGKSSILATHDDRIIEKFVEGYPGFVELYELKEEEVKEKNGSLRKIRLVRKN